MSLTNLPKSIQEELIQTARAIATPGKGILAADESTGTIGKKFSQINVENSKENRRNYRNMLFGHERLHEFISGVIMFEETLYQKGDGGKTFPEILRSKGIIPGIKVDKGLVVMMGTNGESATQGLDDLKTRCEEYYKVGCRFAKWRAVLKIGPNEPSQLAIMENARGLARYASICQESRLVPIVEPEVLQDGKHDIDRCQQVSERVMGAVIQALHDYNVLFEGILLKPNMVTSGYECANKAGTEEIGQLTVLTLLRTVPPAVPGIMFLSGGQSEEEATINLNTINRHAANIKWPTNQQAKAPWILSFSFGRALQNTAVNIWAGKQENTEKAQTELLKRMKANSLACRGIYSASTSSNENSHATRTQFIAKHTY